MKQLTLFITIFGLILTGCEDKKSDDNNHDHDHSATQVTTHDIDADGATGFYYDLAAGAETDSSGSWHISFQMLPITAGPSTYMMPSLVLGSVYAAEYSDIVFEDMESSPGTFMQDYFQDPTVVQYEGASEVLHYDPQSHVVSVSSPDRVFVIYEPIGHTTYKVQFVEYVGGVISFKYSSL